MLAHSNRLYQPDTAANQALREHIAPPDWINPVPDGPYELVVIGAGLAGRVTAAGAAGLGAKVAWVERNALGGECLNIGCVPSKALLSAAKAAAAVRHAASHGIGGSASATVDFPAVMERMRALRAKIAPTDSAERFRSLGVDVYLGEGQFQNSHTIAVGDQELTFSKAVIATGARAIVLPIPCLAESEPLTNETIFSLTELPRRLGIIGAGPIGCELISEVSAGMKLSTFASVIHPYPTLADAVCKTGDAFNRTRFTPFVQKRFRTGLRWSR